MNGNVVLLFIFHADWSVIYHLEVYIEKKSQQGMNITIS
jgi:hypothetical protein